ncbi:hypothetical protein SLE2022_344600 [Rubroshorea leprosula]
MTSFCLIILGLIIPFLSAVFSNNDGTSIAKMVTQDQDSRVETVFEGTEEYQIQKTSPGLRPWKGQRVLHHPLHLRNMHGILSILGWGFLFPVGVIIARYFKKFPLKCKEWYPLHILCQSSAYILGMVGWGIGIWLGNSSKHYTLRTHRILGIIIFTFGTIQMFPLCMQTKREDLYCRCWEIYHHLMGYALIALIVVNIFEGISHQSHEEKWRWVYVGILGILALISAALEIFRWIKSRDK